MEYLSLTKSKLYLSRIALGCFRINQLNVNQAESLICSALESGINLFDHADIYGDGTCEMLFGDVLKKNPTLRDKMVIQTKCGIVNSKIRYFDLSKDHIIHAAENSIQRLHCEYLDILLLHRIDALYDPNEIAEAFDYLHTSGKVKFFGVSNMNAHQLELLQKSLHQKIIINQLKFNPVHSLLTDSGIYVNRTTPYSSLGDGYTLDYCRLNNILIQPWSILQVSTSKGSYLNNPDYQKLNEVLEKYANKYEVEKSAVAVAWILKHPAKMQPICGTTKPSHLKELCKAVDVKLSREEWYDIYSSTITLP